MRDVCARAPDVSSPACLHVVSPRRARLARPAPRPPPLRPLDLPTRGACEIATDASEMDAGIDASKSRSVRIARGQVTVRGEVELPWEEENLMADDLKNLKGVRARAGVNVRTVTVRGEEELPDWTEDDLKDLEGGARGQELPWESPRAPLAMPEEDFDGVNSRGVCGVGGVGGVVANRGARAYVTLPRRRDGAGAALYRGARLPPRRTTPDGTDIYYWCDLPKNQRKYNELDDGAYNPLWAMRGFTQTFHLWKEGKRQQSAPLNAFLTYVTLPWWSIAKDILDHREEPILTF